MYVISVLMCNVYDKIIYLWFWIEALILSICQHLSLIVTDILQLNWNITWSLYYKTLYDRN